MLQSKLKSLGIKLRSDEPLLLDSKAKLKLIMQRYFGSVSGFVDTTGDLTSEAALAMTACDLHGPLMINIVKRISTPTAQGQSQLLASVHTRGGAWVARDHGH
jgi:hypothetical protein